MTVSERIKVLCAVRYQRSGVGSPDRNITAKFNWKNEKESFTIAELEDIAQAVNGSFEKSLY